MGVDEWRRTGTRAERRFLLRATTAENTSSGEESGNRTPGIVEATEVGTVGVAAGALDGKFVGLAGENGVLDRGCLRRICAAGPPVEGVSDKTTTGRDETVEEESVGAAADAIEGGAVGVAEAVGVLDRG